MKIFAELIANMELSLSDERMQEALKKYFRSVPPAEAAWALYFLFGKHFKALVKFETLREWAKELAGISDWLFENCHETVGDLSETIALIIPSSTRTGEENDRAKIDQDLGQWMDSMLAAFKSGNETEKEEFVKSAWSGFNDSERLIFNRIITGTFRKHTVLKNLLPALSDLTGLSRRVLRMRLSAEWQPCSDFWHSFLRSEINPVERANSYEFSSFEELSYDEVSSKISPSDCFAEWLYPGVRALLVKHSEKTRLWSTEDEQLESHFPEIIEAAKTLPDGTVIDGRILAWDEANVVPEEFVLRRMQKKLSNRNLEGSIPCVFMASDLLQTEGKDITSEPLQFRKDLLEQVLSKQRSLSPAVFEQLSLFSPCKVQLSPNLRKSIFREVENSTQLMDLQEDAARSGATGILLRQKESAYSSKVEAEFLLVRLQPAESAE